MSTSVGAPQQYKQSSRKGKKAWRKNVDVTEVQEGLEQVREEVIKGGVLAEKPSEELFTLDPTGDKEAQQEVQKRFKSLRADEILAQRSAISAIDSRKRPSNSRVTDGIIEPKTKRSRSDWVTREEWLRLKKVAQEAKLDESSMQHDISHDPWAVDSEKEKKFSFLEEKKPIVAPKTLSEAPVSLAANGKKIPSVIKPKAGTSYNPSFQEWDELLTKEGEKEVEAERARLEEQKREAERIARIEAAEGDDGQIKSDDESAWEGFESEYENESIKKKRPERKTKAQRNKILRRKEAERKAKAEANIKKREQQAAQAKAITKQITEKEKAKLAMTKAEESSGDDEPALRKRPFGGRTPVPAKPLELVLPEELKDSLLLLKPEGNLLGDRYRSLMLQGKLEARNPITQSKKAKRKATEKWTYKDFKVPSV
ncbi:hypothetical protein McanMca71_000587 [Microsporum canis]|uniref:Ribosome biogenesis protein NOP53 n=1 Tax=Arthroderma otae (strain ATCC MYA-4605 / CBS 113480) TaxID=554155 RepID=C5FM06_ARTOC|nr:60S ribosome subunit biogenesis protein NOP53 [Microsporum canis CBS 113480]EEQ30728.1 p60 domain-containing protein [Microsporum canis CBS 113480]